MAKRGKRYRGINEHVDRLQLYTIDEAVSLVKKTGSAKFDETVDLASRLGIDARQADQNIRGTVALPHGTGKSVRVVVFAQGDPARQAEEAGADFVGTDELVDKIVDGWLDFDATIATPDLMRSIMPKLGRILGPRGLMPNAKAGTVTMDVAETIQDIKAGQIEYRVERSSGIVHVPIGKVSFEEESIKQNLNAVMSALVAARPSAVKGRYIRSVAISATMGAAVRIDPQQFA
ncbi:50S ribosomal protein L1 [Candidatus Poribacteria bacterium]|nr:50S ribosomal protein L1 [Candidatus Poribacteria bacterium]MDE0689784.1 50S ribosomal protein L1 [Candidatus Poribacteria bacterium]MXV84767.1 50S ribosomal protein L1 [Candidatus Poribacteria bacterium]MYA58503.1 50S ribosomal protein L1 [Candidatus Poribacteria bacterium]